MSYDELLHTYEENDVMKREVNRYKKLYGGKTTKQLKTKIGDLATQFIAVKELIEERA